MAILYGTQSNGETLPVLVDQFGNLLAKGIEGPQGPPGVGQLPADPFEGAILGWEDGQLAWLGGSVPLPGGTYGPFVYDNFAGTLTVPQDVSELVNGQQLIMSDREGQPAIATYTTDQIASVEESTSLISGSAIGEPFNTSLTWARVFDRVLDGSGAVAKSGDYKFVFARIQEVAAIEFLSDYAMNGGVKVWDENDNPVPITTANSTAQPFSVNPYPNTYTTFDPQGATGGNWNKNTYLVPSGKISAISVNGSLRLQGVVLMESLLLMASRSNF